MNVPEDSRWWIFGVVSLIGIAIGLIVTFVSGHGGRDSATVELVAPPMKTSVVPGMVIVTILGLASGVGLCP